MRCQLVPRTPVYWCQMVPPPTKCTATSLSQRSSDPNNPMRIRDDATADVLRAEIMKNLKVLVEGGIIDPEELLTLKRRTVN